MGRSARPLKPTSFGQTRKVEVSGWLDLDTGKTSAFQDVSDVNRSVELVRKDLAWARAQGFDLLAAPNQLRLLELEVADLTEKEWEQLTPADLTERISRSAYAPPALPPGPTSKFPLIHGFRTREGAIGMLEILRFDAQRTNSTLRYRLVERAHFE